MKVIHVPFCYWPDPAGGTEVYVESLAREQQQQGLKVTVAAPGKQEDAYVHNGINVRRFRVASNVEDLRELYGEGDVPAARAFARVLEQQRADLVHLHAFTRGVSLELVREVKRQGVPVVFSYHTPTVSCQRGTLLRWGSEVCDGVLDVGGCASCSLHGHGLNKIASVLAGRIPSGIGHVLGVRGASGGIWTAVRMTDLVGLRQKAFRDLMDEVDHVIALCGWVKDLLVRNLVPENKITVSLQGLDDVATTRLERRRHTPPIRIAFLGRLDPTKGVDILIQALKRLPGLSVLLDIFGVVQGGGGASHLETLKALANGDARITFHQPIGSDNVVGRLGEYDILAVPSQGLETGPRVVLEAFAAGVPVIGSNLGGIAELVEHGSNGLLVEPRSSEAWASAIESLCNSPDVLARLRSDLLPPRSVRAVVEELQQVYSKAVGHRAQPETTTASA